MTAGALTAAFSRQEQGRRSDLNFLLSGLLGCTPLELPLKRDLELSPGQQSLWQSYIQRLDRQEPPQYILGKAWFYGLELEVNPWVLIPRPETEILVECALRQIQSGARVLDIGTGSGAIAIAIKHRQPQARVTATEISTEALLLAERNARRHDCRIEFVQADLWPQSGSVYDLIVSNPPYVSDSEYGQLEPRVRAYEPRTALWAGSDGLDVYRRILDRAGDYLAEGGLLCLEHGATQRESILALAAASGFICREALNDLAGLERCLLLAQ
ncbi:MAG TPA: peptide chain release factor N(5)-glutamine methyltransferase [Candidatus Syntrophosphaera sp.]|nr:peptide chain release factor N(5)-glutamine methyltransferase [Candidatus Syntrophosphaera sp.]